MAVLQLEGVCGAIIQRHCPGNTFSLPDLEPRCPSGVDSGHPDSHKSLTHSPLAQCLCQQPVLPSPPPGWPSLLPGGSEGNQPRASRLHGGPRTSVARGLELGLLGARSPPRSAHHPDQDWKTAVPSVCQHLPPEPSEVSSVPAMPQQLCPVHFSPRLDFLGSSESFQPHILRL